MAPDGRFRIRECGFVQLLIVVLLIPSLGQLLFKESQSFGRSRMYLSSFIDSGIDLPGPGVGSVLVDPNESAIREEALFATYSFCEAGTVYNVEFYYRHFGRRIRVRVLVGDRELRGLRNRFYQVDPTREFTIFVVRRDSSPLMHFHFGTLPFKELPADTDAVYDAVEALAQKTFQQTRNPRIFVYQPPGLLRKTFRVSVNGVYLVNEAGQVDPFTLENLRVAYNREGIRAETPDGLERIGRSLIDAEDRKSNTETVLISDANEIPLYSHRPLDPADEKKIMGPRSFSIDLTNYWTCYTYRRLGGVVAHYTFGSRNGRICVANKIILGRRIGGAEYVF